MAHLNHGRGDRDGLRRRSSRAVASRARRTLVANPVMRTSMIIAGFEVVIEEFDILARTSNAQGDDCRSVVISNLPLQVSTVTCCYMSDFLSLFINSSDRS